MVLRLNQLLRIHVFKSHGPSGVPAEGQFHGLPVNQAVKNAEQLVHRWRKGQLDKTVWLPGYPLLTTAEDDPGRRDLKRPLNHQREQARLRARARRSCHQKELWRLFTSRFVKGGGLHFNLQGAPRDAGELLGSSQPRPAQLGPGSRPAAAHQGEGLALPGTPAMAGGREGVIPWGYDCCESKAGISTMMDEIVI